jgi:hypothetical protein
VQFLLALAENGYSCLASHWSTRRASSGTAAGTVFDGSPELFSAKRFVHVRAFGGSLACWAHWRRLTDGGTPTDDDVTRAARRLRFSTATPHFRY